MQEGEIAYLAMVIIAGLVFMATLAWATYRTSKKD
jgi:hypothetical protein